MTKIEQLNKLIPWGEQEGDSDGYAVTDQVVALGNLKYAMKIINEFDGSPTTFKSSSAQAVGDLSALFSSIPIDLEMLAELHPTFNFGERYQADPNSLHVQEIYQVNGVEKNCGKYVIYQQEISLKNKHPYAGRILRLTRPNWEKIFW